MPTQAPPPDWLEFGSDPKSVRSLTSNIGQVLDVAAERGDRVLLMTFAAYVPEGYSVEAFREKRLGYGLHTSEIEVWDRPEHVQAALAAQNDASVPSPRGIRKSSLWTRPN